MPKNKLTLKQQKFIDYYIELGNATEAAIKAGYNKNTAKVIGCQNLTKLNSEISKKIQAKDNERIASQDEVLRFFTSILRNEEKEEIPILCGDGCQELVQKSISAKDRLRAAELLSKRYGLDRPEQDSENNINKVSDILVTIRNIAQKEVKSIEN